MSVAARRRALHQALATMGKRTAVILGLVSFVFVGVQETRGVLSEIARNESEVYRMDTQHRHTQTAVVASMRAQNMGEHQKRIAKTLGERDKPETDAES
ncbi:hypothetical protein FVE85_4809 [Porphyridium purpureum]|uniref:Uncharacterized protein n=1 Tax=Porphyridium purpureum TaxID=35688 RepID=A0A5J4YS55_PORPP|nr:hypothetical protein FVE85_4809 [Porphyridium purpureum]|eukprot:POR2421..scf236_6